MSTIATTFDQSYFRGTRDDLRSGDLIVVGYVSNFSRETPLIGVPNWPVAIRPSASMSSKRFGIDMSTTRRGWGVALDNVYDQLSEQLAAIHATLTAVLRIGARG